VQSLMIATGSPGDIWPQMENQGDACQTEARRGVINATNIAVAKMVRQRMIGG